MIERSHIICSNAVVKPDGSGTGTGLFLPGNCPDWHQYCEAIGFEILITGVNDSATAWELSARFQLGSDHVSANQWSVPTFIDLQDSQVAKLIDEGVGWAGFAHTPPTTGAAGILANQADGTPSTSVPLGPFSRVIRPGGRRPRVALTLTASGGGANQGVLITAIATPLVRG